MNGKIILNWISQKYGGHFAKEDFCEHSNELLAAFGTMRLETRASMRAT